MMPGVPYICAILIVVAVTGCPVTATTGTFVVTGSPCESITTLSGTGSTTRGHSVSPSVTMWRS